MLSAYGTVSGGTNSHAALAFPQAGKIATIRVAVGDRVDQGQIVARLDPGLLENEVEGAQANLDSAQAAYRRTTAGVRPQQLGQTDAQLQGAQKQLALARSQLERQRKLQSYGVASRSDVEAAQASVAAAQTQADVLAQQHTIQQHPWQPDVDAARAAVAQAQAALAGARRRLAYANLAAPFAGIVVARLHNDGESVDANTPVLEIASNRKAVFTAQFAPRDAAGIHVGDRATISAQGVAQTAPGRVLAVNPDQGDARTIPVLIRLATSSVAFGPGAYGKASIRVGTRSGLIVPKVAIVTDAATGSVQVFRRDGDHFSPVPITVLDTVGDSAIVSTPALHSGTIVAGQGAFELLAPPAAPKADND